MRKIDFFRGGGYVKNERNQLQKTPRILVNSSGCGGFTNGVVSNGEKI
jgi:hypothetical protein